MLAFIVAFCALVSIIAVYFVLPALDAANHADAAGRRQIAAWSRLLLAILLFILLAGLMLTVRIGRFFFPRPTPPRTRTQYTDAWSESARRLETPPAPDDEDPPQASQ
jgi:hypothetical protein